MRNFFAMMICSLVTIACVDDYTEANQPHQLDAPSLTVSATAGANQLVRQVPVNPFQLNYEAYVGYGGTSEFSVNVQRAPGKVASVNVAPSIPEYGTVTLNDGSVTALAGKTQGAFTFTFTPNPALVGTADRKFDLVITVTDSQLDTRTGESSPQATVVTLPTTMAKAGCFGTGITPMIYRVTSATGNFDGGTTYTIDDIEADLGGPVLVNVSMVRAGRYTFNEISGGIWPVYYSSRANPALDIDLCGTTITGHEGAVTAGSGTTARLFTITGTLNDNGTITINWSYVRTNGSTPASPAMGTYTLSPL